MALEMTVPMVEGILSRTAARVSSEEGLEAVIEGRVWGVKVSGEGERLLLL